MCPRCNDSFPSRHDLQDHSKVPLEQMCQSRQHDPEDGVDSLTAAKVINRRFPGQGSVEDQWKELWNLLFPGDKAPENLRRANSLADHHLPSMLTIPGQASMHPSSTSSSPKHTRKN